MYVDIVQELPAEAVSNEPSGHVVTRKASSALNIAKSPSWPSFKYAIQPMTAMNGIDKVPLSQDTPVHHDDDITTTSCQPAEEQDALYFSINHSSLHNKGDETMDINGPFCEGLSGCIDDYSDYSTNKAEEGSYCLLTFVPNYYIPENPPIIVVDESPLVLQDGPNEVITVSVPTSTSGKKE